MSGVTLSSDGAVARVTLDPRGQASALSAGMIVAPGDPEMAARIKGFN